MDVHQPYLRQLRRRGNCSGHRVGDVVELQIEEYIEAQARELFDCPRALSSEELQPYLEKACRTAKPPRQGAGRPQAVNV
jgi:hypothetical protein